MKKNTKKRRNIGKVVALVMLWFAVIVTLILALKEYFNNSAAPGEELDKYIGISTKLSIVDFGEVHSVVFLGSNQKVSFRYSKDQKEYVTIDFSGSDYRINSNHASIEQVNDAVLLAERIVSLMSHDEQVIYRVEIDNLNKLVSISPSNDITYIVDLSKEKPSIKTKNISSYANNKTVNLVLSILLLCVTIPFTFFYAKKK